MSDEKLYEKLVIQTPLLLQTSQDHQNWHEQAELTRAQITHYCTKMEHLTASTTDLERQAEANPQWRSPFEACSLPAARCLR